MLNFDLYKGYTIKENFLNLTGVNKYDVYKFVYFVYLCKNYCLLSLFSVTLLYGAAYCAFIKIQNVFFKIS